MNISISFSLIVIVSLVIYYSFKNIEKRLDNLEEKEEKIFETIEEKQDDLKMQISELEDKINDIGEFVNFDYEELNDKRSFFND